MTALIDPTEHSFPRAARITQKADFERIYRSGKRRHTKHFVLVIAEGSARPRIGITVSKKVSKRANKRNAIKRRIRELFRLHQQEFLKPLDLVIIAKKGADECEYEELARQILGCLRHKHYMQPRTTQAETDQEKE